MVGVVLVTVVILAVGMPSIEDIRKEDCLALSGFYLDNEGSDLCVTEDQKIIKVY